MITHILWDWNGTLLNDAAYSMGVINGVLKKHGLPVLKTLTAYQKVFTFPVIKYYEALGLGGALYDEAAMEWFEAYYKHEADCTLFQDAEETLATLKQRGVLQAVISASAQPQLRKQVASRGVENYFDATMGLNDIHARSKVDIAKAYIQNNGIDPRQTLFIGDTTHDAQVARAIKCHGALLPNGHQTLEALEQTGLPIFHRLKDVPKYIEIL